MGRPSGSTVLSRPLAAPDLLRAFLRNSRMPLPPPPCPAPTLPHSQASSQIPGPMCSILPKPSCFLCSDKESSPPDYQSHPPRHRLAKPPPRHVPVPSWPVLPGHCSPMCPSLSLDSLLASGKFGPGHTAEFCLQEGSPGPVPKSMGLGRGSVLGKRIGLE